MLIAQKKRKENIAEYLIYMFQVENLIRSVKFNIQELEPTVINTMSTDDNERQEIVSWYTAIAKELQKRKFEEKGHVEEVTDVINELYYLHTMLITIMKDEKYLDIIAESTSLLEDFRKHSDTPKANDIEMCLNGTYAHLMFRVSGKELNKETSEAFTVFAKQLAYLAAMYIKMQSGDITAPFN